MTASPALHRFRPALWFGALALLLLAIEHTVTRLPVFALRPALPLAVLFDVLVVLPGLFYLLVVRRYQLPLSTVAAAVGLCLPLAYWLIPPAQMPPLRLLHWLPALLEGITLLLLAARGRRLVRAWRAAGAIDTAPLPRLALALEATLGRLGIVLVSEIDMLRYALLSWRARAMVQPGALAFSTYRESGFLVLVVMFGVVMGVETAVVHLLASHWSATLAGWLLLADVYALLFLIAHAHAVRLNPVQLTADALDIRVGFFWRVQVPRAALQAAAPLRGDLIAAPDTLNLAKPLLTAPNLLLTLAAPVPVRGLYGVRRTARHLALYVDQPAELLAALAVTAHFPTR